MGETAKTVIQQLLISLTLNHPGEDDSAKEDASTNTPSAAKKTNSQQTNPPNEEMVYTSINSLQKLLKK